MTATERRDAEFEIRRVENLLYGGGPDSIGLISKVQMAQDYLRILKERLDVGNNNEDGSIAIG